MRPPFISSRDQVRQNPVGVDTSVHHPDEVSSSPLDRDATVYRDGVAWKFTEGKFLVGGMDVNRLLNDPHAEIGTYMGLAEGLTEYRKAVAKKMRDTNRLSQFEAMVEAMLGKILGRLKKAYDQKMSGLSWSMEDGQFILNGINIRSFLGLYRIRKTDKARKFLKGLKGKLAIILENGRESPDYERIREVVFALYEEMDSEISDKTGEQTSGPSGILLPPPSRNS